MKYAILLIGRIKKILSFVLIAVLRTMKLLRLGYDKDITMGISRLIAFFEAGQAYLIAIYRINGYYRYCILAHTFILTDYVFFTASIIFCSTKYEIYT